MAVTLTQLVAFLTVVRRGSVTAAAEELVVTQPSVSAAVNALERELGVTLTERAGRTCGSRGRGGASAHPADQRRDHRRRVPGAAAAAGVPRAAAGRGDLTRR